MYLQAIRKESHLMIVQKEFAGKVEPQISQPNVVESGLQLAQCGSQWNRSLMNMISTETVSVTYAHSIDWVIKINLLKIPVMPLLNRPLTFNMFSLFSTCFSFLCSIFCKDERWQFLYPTPNRAKFEDSSHSNNQSQLAYSKLLSRHNGEK